MCRFMPLLAALGSGTVNSHTTTLKVELRSKAALAAACMQMGGEVLGEGEHRLYGTNLAHGFGIRLPGWSYPLVLREDGQLAFDTYGGRAADLPLLTRAYVLAAAREAAGAQGWMIAEQSGDSITVVHPSGGRLTVKADGTCEAVGFCGTDCHATGAIEQAIGSVNGRTFKPEYDTPGAAQMSVRRS